MPMSLNSPRRVVLIAIAMGLAACSPGTPSESTAPKAATAPAVEPPTATAAPAAAPAPDNATSLVANQWQLTAATDGAGQPMPVLFPAEGKPLGLIAADGRLSVAGSCNRISAGYQWLDAATLQLSAGLSTRIACPKPLADADDAMARFLGGTLQLSIAGASDAPQLRLTAADGSVLTFSGRPTPETRFGGPGARGFLEVSPQPCVAPAPAARPCLMVRDRQFDDNGLPSGTPGEWRALPEGIEGFTPVDGEQSVVRVTRFEKAGADGSPPTQHFVFDMTVETRTVE
jgi:heat shock protein HslJ